MTSASAWTHEQEYDDLDRPLAWWAYGAILGLLLVGFVMEGLWWLWIRLQCGKRS